MRRFLLLPALALGLIFTGCNLKEDTPSLPEQVQYSKVSVNLDRDSYGVDEQPQTRSLVSISVENFRYAKLFAFDATSGVLLTYDESAGELSGQPIVKYTESRSFDWILPLNVPMKIYTIVNYGDLDLSSVATKGDLDALTFTSSGPSALKALETNDYGLPMTGIKDVELTTPSSTVDLTVKKLFAKYEIYFDTSAIESEGWNVQAMHLIVENANTEVPYFSSTGYKQQDHSKLVQYDRATEDDLETIQDGGDGNSVILYILENCQGNISGATSWKTVYQELGTTALSNCTYLDLAVKVVRDNGEWQNLGYQIYLGKTDMKSNFDVERNLHKTICLPLKVDGATHGFVFVGDPETATTPGGTLELPFETTLALGDITVNFDAPNIFSVQDIQVNGNNTIGSTSYPRSGKIMLRANSDLNGINEVTITAGSSALFAQDQMKVSANNVTADVTEYRLSETSHTMYYDETFNLSLESRTVHYVNGQPESSTSWTALPNSSYSATSGSNSVATVTKPSGKTYVIVEGVNGGTTSITLTPNADNSQAQTCTVTVQNVVEHVIWYEIEPSSSTIMVGEYEDYKVWMYDDVYTNGELTGPDNNPDRIWPNELNWSSSDTGVATIFTSNSIARATGVGAGTTTITATLKSDSSVSVEAELTVESNDIITYEYRYEITPESSTIIVGNYESYNIYRYEDEYTNGSLTHEGTVATDVTSDFNWSSSQTGVATVIQGEALGIDYGTTTITATKIGDSSVSLTATLNVRHLFEITSVSNDEPEPGETVTVYFETTLNKNDIAYNTTNNSVSIGDNDCSGGQGWFEIQVGSNVAPGTSFTASAGNELKNAVGSRQFTVAAHSSQVTVTSIEIREVVSPGFLIWQPAQYQFECDVTLSDGTSYSTSNPQDHSYFSWWSSNPGQEFICYGNGAFEIPNDDEFINRDYEVYCDFDKDGITAEDHITIQRRIPTFEVGYVTGGRVVHDDYDYLYVDVEVEVYVDGDHVEDRHYQLRDSNDQIQLPGLLVIVNFDYLNGSNWDGCDEGIVPHGATARATLFVNGIWTGSYISL